MCGMVVLREESADKPAKVSLRFREPIPMTANENSNTELKSGQDTDLLGSHVISGRDLTHAHYSYVSIHSNAAVVKMVKHQKKCPPPQARTRLYHPIFNPRTLSDDAKDRHDPQPTTPLLYHPNLSRPF